MPAPLQSGCFYPAAEFHLHSRQPLPLPDYLCVSRNHFNREWIGERRLKNAVCVLEWIPSASALREQEARARTLSPAQASRLQQALELLDLQGNGRFGPTELWQALRAAEDLQLS